jgi:signal transduction histidine kinase
MEVQNIQVTEEEIFNSLEKNSEKKYIQIAIVGVSVQFVWTILDWMVVPQLWMNIFIFRFIVFAIPTLICFIRKQLGIRAVQCMYIAAVAISLVSMFATFSVPADKFNNYVLGDIVFFVGVGMLATWSLVYSIFLLLVSVSFASFIFYLNCPMNFQTTLTEGGFSIGSIALLSVVMVFLRHREQVSQAKTNLILAKSNEIIKQKSLENNTLQVQLHENEKSTLVSEITASISHELNTPMSVILNGSKALKETTSDLIQIMKKIDQRQWGVIIEIAEVLKNRKRELSSIKQFEESMNIEKIFASSYSKELDSGLSRSMVSSGFTADDTECFDKIGNADNYEELIQVIIKTKLLEEFNESIESAINKSSAIIYDLKSFVDANVEEHSVIDLRESLENALYLYFQDNNRDFTKNIVLRDSVLIQGNEIKITQIWFKLLDFVSSQIGQTKENLQIRIFVKEVNDKVYINFRFNQPSNPTIKLLTDKTSSTNQNLSKDQNLLNLSILQNLFVENNLTALLIDLHDEFEIQIQLVVK